MLTKQQLRMLEPFSKNIFREYSIKDVKEGSNEKSNNAISIALKRFKEEELVKERAVGRTLLYSFNLDNDSIFDYISLINSKKLPRHAQKAIDLIKKEVEKHTLFYSLAVFGSYSTNEQKKDSDLDVAVFIEQKEQKKKIEAAIKSASIKSVSKIDGHAITKSEFLEMLKADYENLGKQIARKHLIIHNPPIFYSLIKEGIKNGFRI